MKARRAISIVIKAILLTPVGLALFVAGVIISLYSPWLQDGLRRAAVERLNREPGVEANLDAMSLRWPLNISLDGLSVAVDGDTLVAADSVRVSARLLPLLAGRVELDDVMLAGARYRMGAQDSAMFMIIDADDVSLRHAVVTLDDMNIDVPQGRLSGVAVSMDINPDTVATAQTASEPSTMRISLGRLDLDNLEYRMRLLPAIDSLGATITRGCLAAGVIDMGKQSVTIGEFTGSRLSAAYIAPDSAIVAGVPVVPATPADSASAPWTVTIDSLSFSDSHALYTTRGLTPQTGLDFGYIEVDSLDIAVEDFYNQAATVRIPMRLSGVERCGLRLAANGVVDIDSTALRLDSLYVSTPSTELSATAVLGMGDLANDPSLPLSLSAFGQVSPADLRLMFPAFTPYLATLPRSSRIKLDADLDGTVGRLHLRRLDATVNGCVSLAARGDIENVMMPDRLAGDVTLQGNIYEVNAIKDAVLDKATAASVNIPPMTLDGHVAMRGGRVTGVLDALTGAGTLALDVDWNMRGEDYDATVVTKDFPIDAFMPLLGAGAATADISVKGHGYDPFKDTAAIDAVLNVSSVEYQGYTYTDITGTAILAGGNADVRLSSANRNVLFDLTASGNLSGDTYNWTATLDGRHIDLKALRMTDVDATLRADLYAAATIGPGSNDITADVNLISLAYHTPTGNIDLADVNARLVATDSSTVAAVENRDLTARFDSPMSLDSLMTRFGAAAGIVDKEIALRRINVDTLQRVLPRFTLTADAGRNNMLNDILAGSKMSLQKMSLYAANDHTLLVKSQVIDFATGSTRIDTVTAGIVQFGPHLAFRANINNAPGTLDRYAHVTFEGFMARNMLGMHVKQRNISDKEGFNVGFRTTFADSTATLNIVPYTPVIGYKNWTVNKDNFITYTFPTRHVDANLRMYSDRSGIEIYTEHAGDDHQEDLIVKLKEIYLQEWLTINPFAPPVKGDLSVDMRLNYSDNTFNGKGALTLGNFYYGKERVADLQADIDVVTAPGGLIRANADMLVDGVKAVTLSGALNDTTATSPFMLDFSMIRFPLATVNPFLPPGVARLSGVLNGTLDITGDASHPILNGYLDFDSTAVKIGMLGSSLVFSDEKIPVDSNVVRFDRFAIRGVNANPLYIDGTVNMANIASPDVDLALRADNMQLLDTRRAAKGADVYGKAFISLDSKVRGNMNFMQVDATLTVEPGTNATYIMTDAQSAIESQSTGEMVRFVNFSDTVAVAVADSVADSGMALLLNAMLNIESGTTVGVDISANGKDRVQLQPEGSVQFTMSPVSDGRLSGRININEGFVRYTPPFMSEKNFKFVDNSYIAFNGDMMNPTLNIHAVDVLKANVTQEGQDSRLVNFDVLLSVTGSMSNMDVAFDLATDDDITVANELQSMSAEQRANQAMNMLLYNVYTGPGTKAGSSLAGNPLFSFLESQLNSWAANTIKGVDLSFGIDQYDRTYNGSTSQTMSYSYQVSKTLFNDRFKIVIGGNYSTDANADENFSQNLINDISFEYYMNDRRTMYVRLFRHTGYESILEGEITQTGVGFVYKRKIQRVSDLWRRNRRSESAPEPAENITVNPAETHDNETE